MISPTYNAGMTRTQLFIHNVKAVMESESIRLKDLSEKSGIHSKDLSRLLNGRVGSCTMDRADAICAALGFSWQELTSESFCILSA